MGCKKSKKPEKYTSAASKHETETYPNIVPEIPFIGIIYAFLCYWSMKRMDGRTRRVDGRVHPAGRVCVCVWPC